MSKKILIFDRFNSAQFPGGDTIQINAIKDFLIRENYSVKISRNPLENLESYDYIFIFNLTNPLEAYIQVSAALRYSKPYIIFPVYWNLDKLKMKDVISLKTIVKSSLPEKVKSFIRGREFLIKYASLIKELELNERKFLRTDKIIKEILEKAYYIIPNSYAEAEHLNRLFKMKQLNNRVEVIYNGINTEEIRQIVNVNNIKTKFGLPNDYICCIGGIGPRKNQLNLIKAANKCKVNLVLIGKTSKGYEKYNNYLKKIATNNIYFLGHLSQEETFQILKNSRGHIQPSFIETPGLASLEAATMGLPVIVSKTPPVEEYFSENAIYCDPKNIKSINGAIQKLYNIDNNINNKEWIYKYDWNKVLKKITSLL